MDFECFDVGLGSGTLLDAVGREAGLGPELLVPAVVFDGDFCS